MLTTYCNTQSCLVVRSKKKAFEDFLTLYIHFFIFSNSLMVGPSVYTIFDSKFVSTIIVLRPYSMYFDSTKDQGLCLQVHSLHM